MNCSTASRAVSSSCNFAAAKKDSKQLQPEDLFRSRFWGPGGNHRCGRTVICRGRACLKSTHPRASVMPSLPEVNAPRACVMRLQPLHVDENRRPTLHFLNTCSENSVGADAAYPPRIA